MRLYQCSLVVGLVSVIAACGGSVAGDPTGASGGPSPGDGVDSGTTPPPPATDTGTPPPATDAGPPADAETPPGDHGAASDKYPAFKPEMPELTSGGGDVLKSPVIVTLTFPGETNADTYEAFGDKIGKSAYWKEITTEYGVGEASSGAANHIRMKEALPVPIGDDTIDTWLTMRLEDPTKYGLPAPTDQSIYVLYIDQKSDFQFQGSSVCGSGIGGYHSSVDVLGKQVAYAILPQCPGKGGGLSLVDETTLSSSHEIGEAATDPHPQDKPGFAGVDDNHLAWEFFMQFQSENGDLCEVYRDSFYRPKGDGDFTSMVQRQWSNKSGAAGHNPCVPAPVGAYFNTTPLGIEDITLDLSKFGAGAKFKSKGFKILVGETKTFQVGFYSDAETTPWTLKSSENNAFGGGPKSHNLDVTIDKASGVNGEKANVTVKVLAAGRTKGELLTLISTQGGTQHSMPILIGSQ